MSHNFQSANKGKTYLHFLSNLDRNDWSEKKYAAKFYFDSTIENDSTLMTSKEPTVADKETQMHSREEMIAGTQKEQLDRIYNH